MPRRPSTKVDDNTAILIPEIGIVDMGTGDVREIPGSVRHTADTLVARALHAVGQVKIWETRAGAFKAILRRMMDTQGVERIRGGVGSAAIIGSHTPEKCEGGDAFNTWLEAVEAPQAMYRRLVQDAAKDFEPAAVREIAAEFGIDPATMTALITPEKPFSYVRLDLAPEEAGPIQIVRLDEEGNPI